VRSLRFVNASDEKFSGEFVPDVIDEFDALIAGPDDIEVIEEEVELLVGAIELAVDEELDVAEEEEVAAEPP
jgi:hypothetical protein